jgi:chromate transporter
LTRIKEVISLFIKLGLISFGGPAAHISLFEEEVVSKRKWMTRQHFLDLVGATNLIPGPNSTEMAMHCGYLRAGLPGLFAGGISFLLPAALITGFLAYIYAEHGDIPQIQPVLYGIKPAVIIIILNAVFKLGKKAVKGWKLLLVAVSVAAANIMGFNEILSILAGGIFGSLFLILSDFKKVVRSLSPLPAVLASFGFPVIQSIEKNSIPLSSLFLSFLKIGSVWFGSGYILVAYFDGEFVERLNWLTRQELIDSIAVGQLTPGPLLSTATFIGYQISGIWGAFLATTGIVVPSFFFVMILNPLVVKIRGNKYLSKFLDAVNVSALALMLIESIKIGVDVLIDWRPVLIFVITGALFLKFKKINAAYLIIIGSGMGYLFYLLRL